MHYDYYKKIEHGAGYEVISYFQTDGKNTSVIRFATNAPDAIDARSFKGDIGNNKEHNIPIDKKEYDSKARLAMCRIFWMDDTVGKAIPHTQIDHH